MMELDKYIWDNFRKGSITCFEELYDRYFYVLYLYAYHLKPGSNNKEDVIHDIFLELWEKKDKLPEVTHLKAYLMKIVRRKVFSRTKKFSEIEENEAVMSIEHLLIEKEEEEVKDQIIKSCMQNLTPRQKEVLHLKYYENMSVPEIMSITKLSQQRVYNIISEALSTLKSSIKKNAIFISVTVLLLVIFFWFI
jgi:RNA polymerase sigma factor (sigma-70 family)